MCTVGKYTLRTDSCATVRSVTEGLKLWAPRRKRSKFNFRSCTFFNLRQSQVLVIATKKKYSQSCWKGPMNKDRWEKWKEITLQQYLIQNTIQPDHPLFMSSAPLSSAPLQFCHKTKNNKAWKPGCCQVIKCRCTYKSCGMYKHTAAAVQGLSQYTAADTVFSFEIFFTLCFSVIPFFPWKGI